MTFEAPQWLLLLVVVPAYSVFVWYRNRRSGAVRLASPGLHDLEPTWRQRSRWLMPVFEALTLSLLVFALAGPRQGMTMRSDDAEGIAIQMIIDRSGSMRNDDFRFQGDWVTRLTAVQGVARRFVAGEGAFAGRDSDLIGLLSFARYAESDCPLTLDHDFLLDRLAQLEIVPSYRTDGTAIGDALGLALARLDEQRKHATRLAPDGKVNQVVILLTDGQNNAGQLDPLEAARLAAALDVRVYTIGVGRDFDQGSDCRENVLAKIAEWTGGKSYAASDLQALESIYAEIDQLERVWIGERTYTDYRHLAIEPFGWGPFALPPLVLAGLALLATQMVLESTLFRTVP